MAKSGQFEETAARSIPGHSLELARLLLQRWDLSGRPADEVVSNARALVARALADTWRPDGGLAHTLHHDGRIAIADRYWWPVTEAIGVVAALLKAGPRPEDEQWNRRLQDFADRHFIDHARGGWFPQIDAQGTPAARQFHGKPDFYHALQAALYPPVAGVSRYFAALSGRGGRQAPGA